MFRTLVLYLLYDRHPTDIVLFLDRDDKKKGRSRIPWKRRETVCLLPVGAAPIMPSMFVVCGLGVDWPRACYLREMPFWVGKYEP